MKRIIHSQTTFRLYDVNHSGNHSQLRYHIWNRIRKNPNIPNLMSTRVRSVINDT